MPPMTLRLQAAVDGAEAHLREWLSDSPSMLMEFRERGNSSRAAQLVAVDVLAVLSEAWDQSVEARLDIVTCRLLAWQRLAGG